MAFDLGNGLANAGTAVAATAGAYTLESQKADLENQKIVLADQLAGARQEKQNVFQSSERVATQGFTSGENVLNRQSGKDIAQIGADAAVKAAGMHAGATVQAAQIGAASSAANLKATLEQNKPLIDAEVLTKTIANTNAQTLADAKKALEDARTSSDPNALKAAQQKVYDAEYSSQSQVQQVSLYQAQAKISESAMNLVQSKIASLQASPSSMMPETQATIRQLQAQLKQRESEFNAAMRTADDALKNLPAYNPPGTQGGTTPDLNKYLKAPAAVAPVPVPTGAPSGLVNQPSP